MKVCSRIGMFETNSSTVHQLLIPKSYSDTKPDKFIIRRVATKSNVQFMSPQERVDWLIQCGYSIDNTIFPLYLGSKLKKLGFDVEYEPETFMDEGTTDWDLTNLSDMIDDIIEYDKDHGDTGDIWHDIIFKPGVVYESADNNSDEYVNGKYDVDDQKYVWFRTES